MQKKSKVHLLVFMMLIILGLTFQPAIPTYAFCPKEISSFWKLDELAAGTYFDFIKDNDGTGNLDPTASPAPAGRVNGAQTFDGIDDGIDVPADESFNWAVDESFSIEFWVKRNGPTGAPQVVIGRSAGPTATSLTWWAGIDGTVASFVLGDNNGGPIAVLTGTTNITNDAWHHVVAVRDGDNDENRLYVDGQEESTSPINATYNAGFDSATADLNIGYWNFKDPLPGAAANHLGGMIDEVALYDRVLDPVIDIQAHFDDGQAGQDVCMGVAAFVPFPDDTISLWKLDELAPGTYEDAFNGNDGTGNLNPTVAPAPAGRVNGAQTFDGIDDGIDVPADESFNWAVDESFSIEFWVKRNGPTGAPQVVIGRSAGPTATSLTWWAGIDGTVASFVLGDNNGGPIAVLTGTTNITNDAWHHVVAVRDGDNDENRLYVDGQEESTSPINATYNAGFDSATADLNIGYWNFKDPLPGAAANHLGGMIDEVALYDRALDPVDDILAHYTAGQAGNGVESLRPPPVAVVAATVLNVTGGAAVTLDGSGSTAGTTPAGNGSPIATYSWVQTAGNSVGPLTVTAPGVATFTAPVAIATLTFRLTVTADDGQKDFDDVTVNVNGGTVPSSGGGGGGGGGCFINSIF